MSELRGNVYQTVGGTLYEVVRVEQPYYDNDPTKVVLMETDTKDILTISLPEFDRQCVNGWYTQIVETGETYGI